MGKQQRWRGRVFEAEPIDRLSDLFASDTILSSQFFGLRRSVSPTYRPIQRLMLATLADAMDCFLNYAEAHPVTGAAVCMLRRGAGYSMTRRPAPSRSTGYAMVSESTRPIYGAESDGLQAHQMAFERRSVD